MCLWVVFQGSQGLGKEARLEESEFNLTAHVAFFFCSQTKPFGSVQQIFIEHVLCVLRDWGGHSDQPPALRSSSSCGGDIIQPMSPS